MLNVKKAVFSGVLGMALGIAASVACDMLCCKNSMRKKAVRAISTIEEIFNAARRALR